MSTSAQSNAAANVELAAKVVPGIVAVYALMRGLWHLLTKRWRRERRRREQDQAVRAGVRALLDAMRLELYRDQFCGSHNLTREEQLQIERLRHEVDDAREALWVADGNEARLRDGEAVRELRHLRTTMRIVRTPEGGWEEQDVFAGKDITREDQR